MTRKTVYDTHVGLEALHIFVVFTLRILEVPIVGSNVVFCTRVDLAVFLAMFSTAVLLNTHVVVFTAVLTMTVTVLTMTVLRPVAHCTNNG
jgi:hypothetical protein